MMRKNKFLFDCDVWEGVWVCGCVCGEGVGMCDGGDDV